MNSVGPGTAFSRMAHDFPAERARAVSHGEMAERYRRAIVEAHEFAIYPPATQNKKFAHTCRSLQQEIEKLREEKEQVMRAVAHLKSSLDKQGMGGPGFSNREIADALRSAVRTEIYNKGFKSANKYHLPPFIVGTGPWHAAEMKRREEAGHEVDKLHQIHDVDAIMAQAMIAKGHQCLELTFASAGLLKKAKIDVDMNLLRFEAFDHGLLLIGKLPPDLARKMADWPPELAVCDAWANIACAANQFVPNFLKKMDKWRAEGKLVHNSKADNWDPVPAADIERQMNGGTALIPL